MGCWGVLEGLITLAARGFTFAGLICYWGGVYCCQEGSSVAGRDLLFWEGSIVADCWEIHCCCGSILLQVVYCCCEDLLL